MNKYKGFTLIELLIVMGILLILMSIGIGVARYAIYRANRIHHQDAADNLYSALVKYKSENKQYPEIGGCATCIEEQFFAEALGYKGVNDLLKEYLEEYPFDGGSDASYYYYVDPVAAQFAIVCVSIGGIDDETEKGYYCTGDGIGFLPDTDPLDSKEIGSAESGDRNVNVVRSFDVSDWVKDQGFAASN
jgi:prepilin-type N-terminal cleavage/methylation domain-containing protein